MARRIIPPLASRQGGNVRQMALFRCDNCHSETNFAAITEKNFCRCGNYHRANSSDALRFSSCSRQILGRNFGGSVMAPQSDTNTLYVLICSLAGTVLSLAATWIVVAHSFVQPMVA
jgi:hypothetical protein